MQEITLIEEALRALRLAIIDFSRKSIDADALIDEIDFSIGRLEVARDVVRATHKLKHQHDSAEIKIESAIMRDVSKALDGIVMSYDWNKITKEKMLYRLEDAIHSLVQAKNMIQRS